MSERDFPSNVPMCKNGDEVDRQYERAEDDRRPFVAMTEEDGASTRRVVYSMSPTGGGTDRGYVLSDDAVERIDACWDQIEPESDVEERTETEGTFRGLTIDDAQDVADRVADIVWNTDNWETQTQ